jgi:hypothetical protein
MEQHIKQAVETFMMHVRRDLDAHLRLLTTDLLRFAQETQDSCKTDLERAVSHARTDAERAFGLKLEAQRGEVTQEMELRLEADRAELEAANADQQSTRRAGRMDTLERLLGAIRRIDEATTLSGILEALAKGAAAETSRIAVLLVEGDILRTWGHFGFAANATPVDTPIGQTGMLAAAVSHRQTSFVPPGRDTGELAAPAFMQVPVGHTGLVMPIAVAGEVVALLYADDADRPPSHEDAPGWTEEVELLVRHASLRLENVTSERAVEVLTRPA